MSKAKKPKKPRKKGGKDKDGKDKGGDEATADPGTGSPPKVDLTKEPKKVDDSADSSTGSTPKPPPDSTHTPGGAPGARPWRRGSKAGPKPKKPKGKGDSGGPSSGGAAGHTTGSPGSKSRHNRRRQDPPRHEPRTDGEWLRPPPGMKATYSVTITRPERAKPKPKPKASPAAIGRGRPGLPAGTATASAPPRTTAGPTGPAPAPRGKGARPMGGAPAVRDTQFVDSDLTVYDVIESDEDQAEEIMAGAAHARIVAERCQMLAGAIESLKAELMAKSVPGVFVGWCNRLIERAGVVETKAEAVALGLPRASEAIARAGQVAAEHDKPAADLVRDMGHTAPADASYHKE